MRLLPAILVAFVLAVPVLPGSGPAFAGSTPAKHNVIYDEVTESHRKIAVRIDRRLTQNEIAVLADAVRRRGRQADVRTFVEFYLPGQQAGNGTWATATFAPDFKVTINGLRREEEEAFVDEVRADRRKVLGAWLTAAPAAPGRLLIFQDGSRVFAEWRLRSGEKTVEEVVETRVARGKRYDIKSGDRQHYVVTREGELELRDDKTLVAVAERIRVEPLPAVAAPVAQKSEPARADTGKSDPMPAAAAPPPALAAAASVPVVEAPAAASASVVAPQQSPVETRPRVRRGVARAPLPKTAPAPAPRAATVGDLTRQQFMR